MFEQNNTVLNQYKCNSLAANSNVCKYLQENLQIIITGPGLP
jgi:hypothetical protein